MNKNENLSVSHFQARETNRGVAYTATILLGDKEIGRLENPGDGSYTRIYITEEKEAFQQKLQEHFVQLGWDTSDYQSYALEYTFAEHLLDIKENGEVSKTYLEMGILV